MGQDAFGFALDEPRRKRTEPAAGGHEVAAVETFPRRRGQQVIRRIEAARRHEVRDGLRDEAAGDEVLGRPFVQQERSIGGAPAELALEELAQQLVEPEAVSGSVHREEEHVARLERTDPIADIGLAGHRPCELEVEVVEHGEVEDQRPLVLAEPIEDLTHEIVRDDSIVRQHRVDVLVCVRPVPQRQRDELQTCRPPLGALVEERNVLAVHGGVWLHREQRQRLVGVEHELRLAHLGESTRHAPATEGQRRIEPAGRHNAHLLRQALHEERQLLHHRGGADHLQIVEHHDQGPVDAAELREQRGQHAVRVLLVVEHPQRFGPDAPGGPPDPLGHVPPEDHRRIIHEIQRHPGGGAFVLVEPLAHRHGLPIARSGDNQRERGEARGQQLRDARPDDRVRRCRCPLELRVDQRDATTHIAVEGGGRAHGPMLPITHLHPSRTAACAHPVWVSPCDRRWLRLGHRHRSSAGGAVGSQTASCTAEPRRPVAAEKEDLS